MDVTPLLLAAFAAGMVATVNPCGFAMLPAYLGLIVGDRGPGRGSALVVGVSVSAGFVAVFTLSGVLVAAGLRAVVALIPWMALIIGVGLFVVGIAELRGTHVFARLPGVSRSSKSRTVPGLIGFGASYGVASLSCTLPIFLSLVAAALATRSIGDSVAVFVAYGAGMGLVVIVLTLALAAGRDRVLRAIRPIAAHLGTISGWLLVIAGLFIVWYWATVLVSGPAELGGSPLVRLIETLAAAAAGLVSANPLAVGVITLALGLGIWFWAQRPADATDTGRLANLRDD